MTKGKQNYVRYDQLTASQKIEATNICKFMGYKGTEIFDLLFQLNDDGSVFSVRDNQLLSKTF